MTEFTQLTAVEIADGVRARKFRAAEVAGAHLDRIAAVDGRVKAYLAVTRDRALAAAKAVDDAVAAGKDPGPLAGVPVALKDNLCTRGVATTCSSKSLETYVPPYDAHVVERLRAAGAVALGKTNLDEFAMGSSTENSAFGATRNPWDPSRIPGGSSGGSAAAVAARCAALSLGSDTGGSIRQPAALCGITGLKPTYGRVSRYGLIAFASSLDQIGPFSRTVRDAARMLGVVAAPDPRDATCLNRPVPDYEKACAAGPAGAKGLRVGVPKEYFGEGLDPEVRKAVDEALAVYRSLGATVVDVTLPRTKYGIPTYYLVATAEASSNLARYDGVHYGRRTAKPENLIDLYAASRRESLGAEVKRRIMLGTYALSSGYYDAYYLRALKVRRLIHDEFNAAFAQADVIVGPTSPIPAFRAGEKTADPLQMYLCDIFTVCTNLAGIPGISIPCGFTKGGLPVGLQITARAFDEEMIFRAAAAYEGATDWHTKRPAIN